MVRKPIVPGGAFAALLARYLKIPGSGGRCPEGPEEAEEPEIVFEEADSARASLDGRIPGVFCNPGLKGLKRLKRLMLFRFAINQADCTSWAV